MLYATEQARNELKELVLQTLEALLAAGVPSRQKSDKDIPQYYARKPWASSDVVPWNVGERRAMTPAEGVEWLAASKLEAEQRLSLARSRRAA